MLWSLKEVVLTFFLSIAKKHKKAGPSFPSIRNVSREFEYRKVQVLEKVLVKSMFAAVWWICPMSALGKEKGTLAWSGLNCSHLIVENNVSRENVI